MHVRVICCDSGCAEEFEAWGPLEEVEALACDCGCTLQVIGWLGEHPGDEPGVSLLPVAA